MKTIRQTMLAMAAGWLVLVGLMLSLFVRKRWL